MAPEKRVSLPPLPESLLEKTRTRFKERKELLREAEGKGHEELEKLIDAIVMHEKLLGVKDMERFMERAVRGFDLLSDFTKFKQCLITDGISSDDIIGDYIEDILERL